MNSRKLYLLKNIELLKGLSVYVDKDNTINQGTKDALKETVKILEVLESLS